MANRKQKSWIPSQCKIVYYAQSCNFGNLLIKPTYLYNIYSLWFSAYTWDMSVHECILLFNQYQRFSSPYLHLVALSCKNQPHLHIKHTNFYIYQQFKKPVNMFYWSFSRVKHKFLHEVYANVFTNLSPWSTCHMVYKKNRK